MALSASPAEIQIVTFMLNGEEYCVDVMRVREIISMVPLTKAVSSNHYVEGMINLRGNIIPVISLRKRLGMPDAPHDNNTCIAIMECSGELQGFIVDEISDVIRIRSEEIQPPATTMEKEWIDGIINMAQRIVVVMNPQNLTEH